MFIYQEYMLSLLIMALSRKEATEIVSVHYRIVLGGRDKKAYPESLALAIQEKGKTDDLVSKLLEDPNWIDIIQKTDDYVMGLVTGSINSLSEEELLHGLNPEYIAFLKEKVSGRVPPIAEVLREVEARRTAVSDSPTSKQSKLKTIVKRIGAYIGYATLVLAGGIGGYVARGYQDKPGASLPKVVDALQKQSLEAKVEMIANGRAYSPSIYEGSGKTTVTYRVDKDKKGNVKVTVDIKTIAPPKAKPKPKPKPADPFPTGWETE